MTMMSSPQRQGQHVHAELAQPSERNDLQLVICQIRTSSIQADIGGCLRPFHQVIRPAARATFTGDVDR